MFTADQIEEIVAKINVLQKTKSKEEIDKLPEFEEFRTTNRIFYETLFSDQMNHDVFKQMMKMKRKLENGEDQYSVDVKFGQYMAEQYLDPVTKKLKKQER